MSEETRKLVDEALERGNLFDHIAGQIGVPREVVKKIVHYYNYSAGLQPPWEVLDEIGLRIHEEHSKPAGFRDEPRSLERELMLICSEAFEMFEDMRAGKVQSEKIPKFTAQEEEAADIIIRVLESSAYRGWRIGEAVKAKHEYNLTRPHKHGKAF